MAKIRTQKNKSRGNGEGTTYYNKTKKYGLGNTFLMEKEKLYTRRKTKLLQNSKKDLQK